MNNENNGRTRVNQRVCRMFIELWRRRVGNRGEIVAKGQERRWQGGREEKRQRPIGENEMET